MRDIEDRKYNLDTVLVEIFAVKLCLTLFREAGQEIIRQSPSAILHISTE